MIFAWLKNRRRRRLLAEPFPGSWLGYVERNVWQFAHLARDDQIRLCNAARIMVAEKQWEGCQGLEITHEIRVTIAAQASLMVLGFKDYYFDGVQTVLVYPGPYVRPRDVEDGMLVEENVATSGESWHRGPIVLSWPDVLSGGRKRRRGSNLVLHEFAHHLDGLDGEISGTPPLANSADYRNWYEVTEDEYQRLVESARRDEVTLLDDYGASDRAEFFAVATECFFCRPVEMLARHERLYRALAGFYRQDPATWFRG